MQRGQVVQDPNLGEAPVAYLMYDSTGHMAVQLMKLNRSAAVECAQSSAAPSNNTQNVNGYDAYFGAYSVDQKNQTVTHHVEGALAAGDIGKNLIRHFQLSGDTLILTVPAASPDGRQVTLRWARVTR